MERCLQRAGATADPVQLSQSNHPPERAPQAELILTDAKPFAVSQRHEKVKLADQQTTAVTAEPDATTKLAAPGSRTLVQPEAPELRRPEPARLYPCLTATSGLAAELDGTAELTELHDPESDPTRYRLQSASLAATEPCSILTAARLPASTAASPAPDADPSS